MKTINVDTNTVGLDGGESSVDHIGIASDVVAKYVALLVTNWLADQLRPIRCSGGETEYRDATEFRIALAVNRCDL